MAHLICVSMLLILASVNAYWLATPVAVRPRSPVAMRATILNILGVPDMEDSSSCLLLPYNDFPGEPEGLLIGEVQLQELEDDMECRSQIFLNADGSVCGGATDGVPYESLCGFWQSGSGGFQVSA